MDIIREAKEASRSLKNNEALYLRQKETLDTFLTHGAITKAQYDKSLHNLTIKMGFQQ